MAEPTSSNRAAEGVWRAVAEDARTQLEDGLPPTDLQSLLISVADARAARVRPRGAADFRLFALVSSARDTGSARTEIDLLTRHIAVWTAVLETIPHHRPRIELTVFDHPALAANLAGSVRSAHVSDIVQLVEDPARESGRGYYTSLAMRLSADAGALEIGDGGFTNWTAQLTGNAKERCLVSCIATERLTDLGAGAV